jgi:hypothetical protein
MQSQRDRRCGAKEIDLPLMLGMTMVVGAGVATAALARQRWVRERHVDRRREALVVYLREHLGGADLAIKVVDHLRRETTNADDQQLFEWLYPELTRDHEVVVQLLRTLGASTQSLKRLAGQVSGSVLKRLAGGARGELSLFRTFEALSLGVQGKLCMWRALPLVRPHLPAPGDRNYRDLESDAMRQWEAIDARRLSLAGKTFAV